MQIDGHHTITYIAARFAGFSHPKASIIAYSAQYVDDATNSGTIHFSTGAMYKRISSAHKLLDYRNLDELANHQVWAPFHFLPGNGGKKAGENPKGSFINKIICQPDSHVARDMLRACIKDKNKPYGLHRLGIAMHVYADTWAHQGFAGVNHKINEVSEISSNVKKLDKSLMDKIVGFFLSESFPLGHGAALSHPDRPYLVWSYKNGLGQKIERDNPSDFIDAADKMCRAMRCYRLDDKTLDIEGVEGLPEKDKKIILRFIKNFKGDTGEIRHEKWVQEIAKGTFSFGPAKLTYNAKGKGSWKHKSISQLAAKDTGNEVFTYKGSFISSHWKCFHDALQVHRLEVVHDILPMYGICVS